MKSAPIRLLLPLLATLGISVCPHAGAATSTGQVTIRATLESVPGHASKGDTETEGKYLNINLTSARSVTGKVTVSTIFYARDLGKRTTVAEADVRKEVALDSSGMTSLKTPDATFSYTLEHEKKTGSGRKVKMTRVEASGKRYFGWVVRVAQGSTLVGEAASSAALLTSK